MMIPQGVVGVLYRNMAKTEIVTSSWATTPPPLASPAGRGLAHGQGVSMDPRGE